MTRSPVPAGLAALVAAVHGTAAHACVVCASPTAEQVRAGLFDGHFLHTLVLTALPFPVFAAVIAGIHFGPPTLRRKGRA